MADEADSRSWVHAGIVTRARHDVLDLDQLPVIAAALVSGPTIRRPRAPSPGSDTKSSSADAVDLIQLKAAEPQSNKMLQPTRTSARRNSESAGLGSSGNMVRRTWPLGPKGCRGNAAASRAWKGVTTWRCSPTVLVVAFLICAFR